ncbi:MAG: UPF0104 family protein [Calditrichaeota bacterium]|nr:MAG: UPF0104 family protein [Calditrichota bacterium]
MVKKLGNWKVWIGLVIAALCLFLAFRKVDFTQMGAAFRQANYGLLLPALLMIFLSHWLRTLRWQLLLRPIAAINLSTLFSALMIGYMTNTFLPAHLGEFVRAYLVAKKKPVAGSAVFATIVIERIIDVFTLLLLMALTIVVFPFPEWVRKSGYISFIFIGVLFGILLLMKKYRDRAMVIINALLKPFPHKISRRIQEMVHSFLDGVKGLEKKRHYAVVALLSLAIWFCYAYIFQIGLHAFNFVQLYNLPWTTSLVLLVITTIAVLVPSSPGYVGTYHYLCQLTLGLFAVPESEALTFAFVVHGINFLPVLIVGFLLASTMGMNLKTIQKQAKEEEEELEGKN